MIQEKRDRELEFKSACLLEFLSSERFPIKKLDSGVEYANFE